MTTVLEAATPDSDTWIHGETISEMIEYIDQRFRDLMNSQLNGNYVKFDVAADVILDVRQGLVSIISPN